jgi:release factor glutamine methyltransferase
MTLEQIHNELLFSLKKLYSINEANCIADMVIEHVFGYSKMNRILHKKENITETEIKKVKEIISSLSTNKPIQYILGEAWFYHKKFYVNEHTLIPRSETEELIEIVSSFKIKNEKIIDIGTGSGCIPITIKSKFENTQITAIDISYDALNVAKQNAQIYNTKINFIQTDFLDEDNWQNLDKFRIIISNPPYIRQSESSTMQPNVILFEPHLALFVPDNDALIFYKKIALFGKTNLENDGKIIVEINEALGEETKQIFEELNYNATIIKDMQGKDRFIVCS